MILLLNKYFCYSNQKLDKIIFGKIVIFLIYFIKNIFSKYDDYFSASDRKDRFRFQQKILIFR